MCSAWLARWRETRAEEHAVSRLTQAPRRPSAKESRPDATHSAEPWLGVGFGLGLRLRLRLRLRLG